MVSWAIPEKDTYFAPILEKTPEGFEIDHLRAALKFCTKYRIALDVGAHIGTWTCYLAGLFQSVWSFEPAEDTYRCLVTNTTKFPNVRPLHMGIGSVVGHCLVNDDLARKGNTGARTIIPTLRGTRMVSLDYMAETCHTVDFIKIDVEGFELEVLKGATGLLARCKPVVVMECKEFSPPRNGGTARAVEFLTNFGYRSVGGIRNDRVFIPK